MPAAEDVEMDVEDGLPGIRAGVEDDPVTGVGHALFRRRPPGREQRLAEELRRSLGGVVERGDVLLGNDQDVDRRLRKSVLESQEALGLEQDRGRRFASDDPAEEAARVLAAGHAGTLSMRAPRPRSFSSIRSYPRSRCSISVTTVSPEATRPARTRAAEARRSVATTSAPERGVLPLT